MLYIVYNILYIIYYDTSNLYFRILMNIDVFSIIIIKILYDVNVYLIVI